MATDLMEKANDVGDLLFDLYMEEGGDSYSDGCGELLMQWAKERLYGRMSEPRLDDMRELWQKLTDNNHLCRDSGLSYGDLDQTVWAESFAGEFGKTVKLVIVDNHVTCADDNVVIFKLSEYIPDEQTAELMSQRELDIEKMMLEFHVFSAWPEEKKRWNTWGDHRDWEVPSLQTYRDHNFEFGYCDARDEWHMMIFKYDHNGPTVKEAHWNENRVQRAIRDINYYNRAFYVDDSE